MSWSSRTATLVLCAVNFLGLILAPTGIAEAQVPPAPSPLPPPAPDTLPVPAPIPVAPATPAAAPPGRRASSADPEVRVDGIIARVSAVHAGLGFTAPVGNYIRAGLAGAVGFSRNGLSGRVDGVARFHFDPFRQSRWAPYGGGGISGRFDRDEKTRAYLMLLLGLDGPVYSGATPSFELGLGGGGRIGLILRRATAERR
jgi:hypothetical protein